MTVTRWQRGQLVTREPASIAFMEYLDALARAADGMAAADHGHEIADIVGLSVELASKADVGHTHLPADVVGLSEAIDDRVAALLVAGSNVTLTYDDTANTLTIDATGGGGGFDPVLAWAY